MTETVDIIILTCEFAQNLLLARIVKISLCIMIHYLQYFTLLWKTSGPFKPSQKNMANYTPGFSPVVDTSLSNLHVGEAVFAG